MPHTRFVIAISLFVLIVILTIPSPERINAQACPPGPKGDECRRKQTPPTPVPSTPRKPVARTEVLKPTATPRSFTVAQTAEGYSVDLGKSVRVLELVSLKSGQFTMGSDKGNSDEKPPHQVQLSAFSIGKYEVTQSQWMAVMGRKNPSRFQGDGNLPVDSVAWKQANDFCTALSQKTGYNFRLPTEAEWEYAARGGKQTEYSFGDDAKQYGEYAWFYENSGKKAHPVGTLKQNPFGLFDMHGNVWEWCSDWYDRNYYTQLSKQGMAVNPRGPAKGEYRVVRGGSWVNNAVGCRSAFRFNVLPGIFDRDVGFRVVL